MVSFVVKNNSESTVADNPLASGATTLNVASGEGNNFPSTFPFRITIWDEITYSDPSDDSGMEIVHCTGRTTDALTIVRAQEGTADVAHTNGEAVALLWTAGILNDATYGLATKLDTIENSADVTDSTNVDSAGAVMEADFNAQTILQATSDNSPNSLTVGEQTVVGRITSGNIAALTPSQIRTLINVEDAADVTDAVNVASSIVGVDALSEPSSADLFALIDTGSGSVLKKVSWTNMKTDVKTDAVVTKTTTYTITTSDETVLCNAASAAFTVTLPAASGNTGVTFNISKIDAVNNVTIEGNGSETINGSLNYILTVQYESVTLQCDGTGWFII